MGSVFVPCFGIQYFAPFLFYNHLDGEERAGCFALTAILMYCVPFSVLWPFPRGAAGWSVVCD